MQQHWSISDIKDKFTSLIVKVGDEFVCMSNVKPNTKNYFIITGFKENKIRFTLQYTENLKTGEIIKFSNEHAYGSKEKFLEKKAQGLYRKL